MLTYPTTQTIPLAANDDGVIRVVGTRIGLDIIVDEYNSGATPEEIAYNYDSLSLADVYAVFAHYLAHKSEIDLYISELDQRAEKIQKDLEKKYGLDDLRQQLLNRQAKTNEISG